MSKFFAAVYDYLNDCDISQLDAILVALFCFVCGCGLILSLFVASVFQPPAGAPKPRLVVQQFASGQTQIVARSEKDITAQNYLQTPSRPSVSLHSKYSVPSPAHSLPPAPSIANNQCCPVTNSTTISQFPSASFSYSYGQPRTSSDPSSWYGFGQAAAADGRREGQ